MSHRDTDPPRVDRDLLDQLVRENGLTPYYINDAERHGDAGNAGDAGDAGDGGGAGGGCGAAAYIVLVIRGADTGTARVRCGFGGLVQLESVGA